MHERTLAPTLLTKEFPIQVNTGTPILNESLEVTPPLHGKVSKERSINLNLAKCLEDTIFSTKINLFGSIPLDFISFFRFCIVV